MAESYSVVNMTYFRNLFTLIDIRLIPYFGQCKECFSKHRRQGVSVIKIPFLWDICLEVTVMVL